MSILSESSGRAGLLAAVLLLGACSAVDPNTRYPVSPRLAKQSQDIYATPNATRGSLVDAVPGVEKALDTTKPRDPGSPRIAWRLYGDQDTNGKGLVAPAETRQAALPPATGLVGPQNGQPEPALWRAALDAVALMPIKLADPRKGVILTDWYSVPQLPDQRVKVAIYIIGPGIGADALRVAIQRQERTADGRWEDRPAAPGSIVQLERRILEGAARLAGTAAR